MINLKILVFAFAAVTVKRVHSQNDFFATIQKEIALSRLQDAEETSSGCECVDRSQCSQTSSSSIIMVKTLNMCRGISQVCCDISKIVTTPNDNASQCQCVDPSQCRRDEPTNQNNGPLFLDLIKPRTLCPVSSQVCCDVTKIICSCVQDFQCADQPLIQGSTCNQGQVCCVNVQIEDLSLPPEKDSGISCGSTYGGILTRVFNGQVAKDREYPWFVAIGDGQNYAFAGSLIHPQIVLTVAHRLNGINKADLTIKIGSTDFQSSGNQIRRVRDMYPHPDFNAQLLYYNLALLILDSPFELVLGVSTICLPVNHEIYHKDECLSGGWGKDDSDPLSFAGQQLRYVNLSLVDHSTCERALQRAKLGSSFRLHHTFVCAGGGVVDTCVGDGGSPLVCRLNTGSDQYVQVGATAWGLGCRVEGVPGVYSSIEDGVSWIQRVATQQFGRDAEQYFTL